MAKIEEYNRFTCLTCADHPVIAGKDFFKHLTEVHGIQEGTQGTSEMMFHMDARDFFMWKYRIKIGDVEAIQETKQARRVADRALWR